MASTDDLRTSFQEDITPEQSNAERPSTNAQSSENLNTQMHIQSTVTQETSQKPPLWKGYLCVFSACCFQLFNGYMYVWGNIAPYVISYYHYKGDISATLASSVIVIPLSYLFNTVCCPIGSYLHTIMDPRLLHFFTSSMMLMIIFASSFMKTWWTFVALYGILFPGVLGFQSFVSLICAWEWFPAKQSIVTGVVFSAFGLSSFFFGFITTYLVNPENEKPKVPDDGTITSDSLYSIEIANKVPHMLRVNTAICAVLAILGLIGISRNPEFVRQEKIKKREELLQKQTSEDAQTTAITIKDCLKSAKFWQLFVMLFLGIFYCTYNLSVYKINA